MKEFIDKTSNKNGTPINREAMMGMQGFCNCNTDFPNDKTITETYDDGVLTTTFNDDGSITETFVGEKTITKTYKFVNDGIVEALV